MDLLHTLNFTIAVCSIALAVTTVALYIDYFVWKGRYFGERIKEARWYIVIGVTLSSVVLSLLYSEYFGFIPCSLCWLQRIAVYPQALMSVFAYRMKDTIHFPVYGIWLSLFGLSVAIYQYVYQMVPKDAVTSGLMPCLADGSNADCAVKVIDEFGFITFPLISAVTFAFLIVVYLYMHREPK